MRRDLGDFQTPPALVAEILRTLDASGRRFTRILEPTCGRGHFLSALLERPHPPREICGIETQPDHLEHARLSAEGLAAPEIARTFLLGDLFEIDLRDLAWSDTGPLLVIGNPPWVTAAELGKLGSTNGPERANPKGFTGLDARTGRSNFDLSEAVWLKLVRELADQNPTIALLCKSIVARNVLATAEREAWPIASASFHRIDSKRWFDASVDAGLFRVELGGGTPVYEVDLYPSLDAASPSGRLGVVDGLVVSDLDAFREVSPLFGRSGRAWRQGVKHDAASVLELTDDGSGWRNLLGESVEVEPELVYPLMKAADLARPAGRSPRRGLILPQRGLSDDPSAFAGRFPATWAYLSRHIDRFTRRKSRIYADRPMFSIFGVGPYSFAPDKVAVSGFSPAPRFRAVGPQEGKAVVFDDTSYFLPCESADEATAIAEGLNGPEVQALIRSLSHPGSKRPITKGLLQRINLEAMAERSAPSPGPLP